VEVKLITIYIMSAFFSSCELCECPRKTELTPSGAQWIRRRYFQRRCNNI